MIEPSCKLDVKSYTPITDMSQQQTIAEILAALPEEQRNVIMASLKRGAQSRAFQHVGYSQYYDTKTENGEDKRTPSGIENPNSLKISYTRKIGRRNAGLTISRGNDNKLSLANATFAPVESISLSRDGRLSITLQDTFSDDEKRFIGEYQKNKFAARPNVPTPTSTPETQTTSETPSAETPASAPPASSAIKVALIKKKLKASDENVALVSDLMKEGGMTLDAAITELGAAS